MIPYTNCSASYPDPSEINCSLSFTFPTCDEYVKNLSNLSNVERADMNPCPCFCNISFEIPKPLESHVNVYYQLNNYYQNHRRYVNSWDVGSLRGDDIAGSHSDCDPFNRNEDDVSYFPCGVIANSFFNGMSRAGRCEIYRLCTSMISLLLKYMNLLKSARTYCIINEWTSRLPKNAIGSCTIDKNSKNFSVCSRMGL